VAFTDVLEVGSEGNLTIGSPVLADALVAATVLAQERPDGGDTAKKHRRNSRRQTIRRLIFSMMPSRRQVALKSSRIPPREL